MYRVFNNYLNFPPLYKGAPPAPLREGSDYQFSYGVSYYDCTRRGRTVRRGRSQENKDSAAELNISRASSACRRCCGLERLRRSPGVLHEHLRHFATWRTPILFQLITCKEDGHHRLEHTRQCVMSYGPSCSPGSRTRNVLHGSEEVKMVENYHRSRSEMARPR
jgi:hypothetical protein